MGAIRLPIDLEDSVRAEREVVAARVSALRDQSTRLHEMTERVDKEYAESAGLLRSMDEMLGLAPQLSIDATVGELRGRRLREIAVEVLRSRKAPGEIIHYREWYELLTETGARIGGRDPLATFLTQIARSEAVEPVRARSGLYRLRPAA